MTLIVPGCPPKLNYEPPSLLRSLVHSRPCYLPWLPHAADGRRAQTACRRYAIAYQTVPPTPPDPTTPALLPSRNQRPRRLFFSLLAGRRVYGEAVQVERGAG